MPRKARQYTAGDYYHIMVRGINKQDIFHDDEDRQRYLDTMVRFSEETNTGILAWCLMSNHVHLLLKADSLPDLFMKKLGCSYVPYYNRKYGRVGHLFQDRYRSEAISDDNYLLAVARYIHRNPEKAHLCGMADYKWSSYKEYLSGNSLIRTDLILSILGGAEGYIRFMAEEDPTPYMDDRYALTEKEAQAVFDELVPDGAPSVLNLPKPERNDLIVRLAEAGLSAAQICRTTGIGKTIVYSVIN